MKLSKSAYHCKPLSQFFASTGNLQSSLLHFFKVMTRLHNNSECRQVVVFPICVREYDDKVTDTMIVFPKLDRSYKIGLPDTIELRSSFVKQLEDAMSKFHHAGVAHLDLYLSNIMWCPVTEEEVKLKIIDWDAAHFTCEHLSMEVQQRLFPRRDEVLKQAARDDIKELVNDDDKMKYYDVSLLNVVKKYINEESLRARDKETLDAAFVIAQISYYSV
jgi:serine/threonine protein kinase